jgi:hypothetical protein
VSGRVGRHLLFDVPGAEIHDAVAIKHKRAIGLAFDSQRAVKLARSDPKDSDTYNAIVQVRAMLDGSDPYFCVFSLFRSVSRDGCTRFGSPGIFGVPSC